MSTKSRGHPFVGRDKSPDIYRQKKEDSYDLKAREYLERHETKNIERDTNVNRHALSTVIFADDSQSRYQLLAGSKTVPGKQEVVKPVHFKSRSEEHKSEPVPPVTRGKSDFGVDSKSKRRLLVKQSTQGKFELKGSNPAGSETKTVGNFEKTGKNSEELVQQVESGCSGKRRTLPATPLSIFHRKDLAEKVEDDGSSSHHGSTQNAGLIIASDKGAKQCYGSSKIETNPGSNLLADKASERNLSKKQYLLKAKSCTQPVVPEVIPLQSLTSKQHPSHGTLSSKDYEKKYKERIRLKDRSVSLKERSVSADDSKYTEHRTLNASAIKSDLSDGKKSVAFCTVRSPSSYDDSSGDHGSSLKPSERYIVSQQKHFLSPENCVPMLEKSKSLQRLANQSSTETSGLGETVTSGLSSQESIASYYTGARSGNTEQVSAQQDQGIDLREDTRNLPHEGNSTFGTGIIDSDNIINHTNEPKKSNRCTYCVDSIGTSGVSISVLDTDASQSHNSHGAIGKASSGGSDINTKDMTSRHTMGQKDHLSVRVYKPPLDFRSNDVKKPDNLPMFSSNVGPDFDTLFTQSKNLKVPPAAVGIQIDQINREWNKHNRSSSVKSRSSQGSFRSRSGSTRRSRRFLGERESQWMKWGRERRLSFRRRMEKLEKPPEPEVPRASTPVKKARQEGLMFVHPDLGSKYISEDDINYIKRHKQERLKTCKLIEKSKTKLHHEAHDINRLTADELMTLSRFWEHRVFVRSRYVSILLSLVTIVIYVLSICSTQWVTYPSPGVMDHYAHEGLWFKCHPVLRNKHYTEACEDPTGRRKSRDGNQRSIESSLWESGCWKLDADIRSTGCKESRPNWQNAVIGLMIFSAAFGFVAAILAICGVCTSPLPKKIYYFHSAGEIFFVCALTTTVALIIYAVAISTDESIRSHTYGSGYGLGWGGTAFFFAASFCMSLDELVRESAQNKCCRYLFWRSRSNDRDNSQHV